MAPHHFERIHGTGNTELSRGNGIAYLLLTEWNGQPHTHSSFVSLFRGRNNHSDWNVTFKNGLSRLGPKERGNSHTASTTK